MSVEANQVTGFDLYMRDQMKAINERKDGANRLREIVAAWRKITPEQQEVYKTQGLQMAQKDE